MNSKVRERELESGYYHLNGHRFGSDRSKADLDIEITHAITGVPSLLFRPGPFKILVRFCIEICIHGPWTGTGQDREADVAPRIPI